MPIRRHRTPDVQQLADACIAEAHGNFYVAANLAAGHRQHPHLGFMPVADRAYRHLIRLADAETDREQREVFGGFDDRRAGPPSPWVLLPAPWGEYLVRYGALAVAAESALALAPAPDHGLLVEVTFCPGAPVIAHGFFAWRDDAPGELRFLDDYLPAWVDAALVVAMQHRGQRLSDAIGQAAEQHTGRVIAPPRAMSGTMEAVWPRRRGWGGQ